MPLNKVPSAGRANVREFIRWCESSPFDRPPHTAERLTMAINPSRAEARLNKTKAALDSLNSLDRKIAGWLEAQDQRQVQVTLAENQIRDLKGTLIPEKIDSPPNAENAPILEQIGTIEQEKAGVVLAYGQTSKLLNEATADRDALLKAHPHTSPESIAAQEQALARKQASFPRLLLRHLYKCKRHGWTDARIGKLAEHRAAIRAERTVENLEVEVQG